jgi:hypothetical protein
MRERERDKLRSMRSGKKMYERGRERGRGGRKALKGKKN